jgi:hypothetical protein
MKLEDMASRLVKQGFYPSLRREAFCWRCELHNVEMKPHRLPTGRGATAMDALVTAVADMHPEVNA